MIDNKSSLYSIIRSFLRGQLLNALGSISTPAPGIHILNGHRIELEDEPATFRHLLSELSRQVTFVDINTAVSMIIARHYPQKPLVAFTFDDGFMECYDVFAPVLDEFGVKGLFFVNPNYVDGDNDYIQHFNNEIVLTPDKQPMRWHHIRTLADNGHIIGAHTMDHYMIATNDEQMLDYQIKHCKTVLEQHLGQACNYFAFPYGKLSHANQKSIELACRIYKYVFSQSDYKHYFSFGGTVINRRHFEPFWPVSHVRYFLSCIKNEITKITANQHHRQLGIAW